MAEGRRSDEWDRWAEILALTGNCHRNPKKSKAFSADEIHPFRSKRRRRAGRGDMGGFFAAMRGKFGGFRGRGVNDGIG